MMFRLLKVSSLLVFAICTLLCDMATLAFQSAPLTQLHKPLNSQLMQRPAPRIQISFLSQQKDDDDGAEMDEEELLEYLNRDDVGAGISFTEYREQQKKQQYLQDCLLFKSCSKDDLTRIANAMIIENVANNQNLIEEGQTGSSMYFLKRGSLQAIGKRQEEGKPEEEVVYRTYSKEGEVFGELSLLFGQPRAATVVATSPSVVYRLDKSAFLSSIMESPVYETARQMILNKYQSKRLLEALPKIRLDEMFGLLKARLFARSRKRTKFGFFTTFSFGAGATWVASTMASTVAAKTFAYLMFALLASLLD